MVISPAIYIIVLVSSSSIAMMKSDSLPSPLFEGEAKQRE